MKLPQEFKDLIEQNDWIFAKTYAIKGPHEYIVKYKMDKKWHQSLINFAKFIKTEGYARMYEGREYTCYDYEGRRYWSMDEDIDKTDLINRAVNEGKDLKGKGD